MEIPFTAPAFDAFTTYFADARSDRFPEYDVEVMIPAPDGPGGVVMRIESHGVVPEPAFGSGLAEVLIELRVDRALMIVMGVPLPAWACALFEVVRRDVAGYLDRIDLLGVDRYRWESFSLRAEQAGAA